MKSVLSICNISNNKDVSKIQRAISSNEGVIACEVSLTKKEVQIIYNESFLNIDTIVDSIENLGYIVV